MAALDQLILRTDASGLPLEWIDYRQAVRLHVLGQIAYSCGSHLFSIRGGVNAHSHRRTCVEVSSILATLGNNRALARMRSDYVPPLNNRTLFKRDGYLCMYCGEGFAQSRLSRDHVTPLSHGGLNHWNNVVTACIRCNGHKAGRRPEEAGMELLAIPFAPSHAEYVFLQGRNILADQMEFLRAHFPRSSPLHGRMH
jgi:5-methylcytosine-specific restriction endonuclease McrA